MKPTDEEVLQVMLAYGNPFVRALANAWSAAKEPHRQRIKGGWPEVWSAYVEIAKTHATFEELKEEALKL